MVGGKKPWVVDVAERIALAGAAPPTLSVPVSAPPESKRFCAALPEILPETLAPVRLVRLAPLIAGSEATVVIFPIEVTFPVRFALVVTVVALPVKLPIKVGAEIVPRVTTTPAAETVNCAVVPTAKVPRAEMLPAEPTGVAEPTVNEPIAATSPLLSAKYFAPVLVSSYLPYNSHTVGEIYINLMFRDPVIIYRS